MGLLDGSILVAFALYAVTVGWRARRRAGRGLEAYFLADRGLSGWSAGASMAATQFAADTPLLVTGLIATAGIFSLWRLWIYAVAFLLLGFVLAPAWRRSRVLTDAELAERRYAGRPAAALRAIKALYFGTVFNCVVLAMVLFAAARIAEPFLLWHAWLPPDLFGALRSVVEASGVALGAPGPDLWIRSTDDAISLLLIVTVTTLYSATGGLRGVVQTDIAQLIVMLVGSAVYAWFVVDAAGGLAGLPERIDALAAATGTLPAAQLLAFTPSRAPDAGVALLAVMALQWLVQMNADGTGYLAQRMMACRSDREARKAALVFSFLQVGLRGVLWLPIGVGLLVIFPPEPGVLSTAEREATFVRGMVELLPAGARGLLVTAMLAALASTLDTHLNWGSSYWTHDLYRRFWCRWRGLDPSERSLVWVARAVSVAILSVALLVMTRLSSIHMAWQASLLLGAGMGVLLVLRWLWWRINAWGEIAAIAASLALVPGLLGLLPGDAEALRLLLVAVGSTTAGIVASLVTRPEPMDRLRNFYETARPPGFWGPVALLAGADPAEGPRRLFRGLAATAAASLSLFALLSGVGTALLGSPAPTWFPWRALWIASLLVLGGALIPLWWRLGGMRTERRP